MLELNRFSSRLHQNRSRQQLAGIEAGQDGPMEIDTTPRVLFDQVAKLYDKARPACPEELFDELIKQIGLKKSAQILEIAPCTGQATLHLARLSYNIVGMELGKKLSEISKENLQKYPNVQIINKAFKDVDLHEQSFDL